MLTRWYHGNYNCAADVHDYLVQILFTLQKRLSNQFGFAGCARADAMVTDVRNNATQLEAARGHPLEGTIDTPSDSSSETGPTCALSTTSDQALKAIRIEGTSHHTPARN